MQETASLFDDTKWLLQDILEIQGVRLAGFEGGRLCVMLDLEPEATEEFDEVDRGIIARLEAEL